MILTGSQEVWPKAENSYTSNGNLITIEKYYDSYVARSNKTLYGTANLSAKGQRQ